MRQIVLALAILGYVAAQSDGNGGVFCNYTATGDEVVENAVPIATFRTSGANTTRRGWCIAYCQDRTSVKATMLFQPSSGFVAARYRRFSDLINNKRTNTFKQTKGFPAKLSEADDMYCTDQTVAATVDAVFAKYTGIDTLTQMLNTYVNKPGWAYLVYELLPGAGALITTENAFTDDNFCMKSMTQTDQYGNYIDYQVFAGLVMST